VRPDAMPPRLLCSFTAPAPVCEDGVLVNPALSAWSTYERNVVRSGELRGSLLRRGRLLDGEGVTARMVEWDVDGRAGEDGGGGGRGRKCVDIFDVIDVLISDLR
jgi:hypothetical protein